MYRTCIDRPGGVCAGLFVCVPHVASGVCAVSRFRVCCSLSVSDLSKHRRVTLDSYPPPVLYVYFLKSHSPRVGRLAEGEAERRALRKTMGLFSRLTGSKPEEPGDAAASTSTATSDSRPKRGLRKFDTAAFTLHEHCGIFSREVQACLQRHKVDPDPVAQQERNWYGVEDCRKVWDEYRTCGRKFFDTVNHATGKCSVEDAAFKRCNGNAECEAAEVRARCRLTDASLPRCLQFAMCDRLIVSRVSMIAHACLFVAQLALLRCTEARIRYTMSGTQLPEPGDSRPS